ncbi:uncharacterized protein LOC136092023 [Hydra vulgaris]|uniref:Uncharacterized protein LOC136092023 n=1 Tax=Hydra vulgaris TaxID=6087 RepID=A0ABM4DML5_HYDVU
MAIKNKTIDFETVRFNVFEIANNILNDADTQIFQTYNFNSRYFETETFKTELEAYKNNFTIIHINIRSINKNFDKLKHFLIDCNYSFSMICLTETWCSDESIQNNSNFQIPNYKLLSSERKAYKKGGGIATYVRNDQVIKVRKDHSISNPDSEVFTIEIINSKFKNIIVSTCYRPPEGNIKKCSNYLEEIFLKINKEQKKLFCIGDLNIDCLKYKECPITKLFFDNMFQHCILPIINKPTRVTSNTISAIDNILTNSFLDTSLKAGIIKIDITDHFPVYFTIKHDTKINNNSKKKIYIRKINKNSIKCFKDALSAVNWVKVYQECNLGNTNSAYNTFTDIFLKHYNNHFPIKEKEIKVKHLSCPWITSGIKKSSKTKQRLYVKYLKNRNEENLSTYKQYKNLFEKIRKHSKKVYYSKLLQKTNGDTKKTWNIMKEIIGKKYIKTNSLPDRIIINEIEHNDQNSIAEQFNNFFANIGPNMASKIQTANNSFENYFTDLNSELTFNGLSYEELENAKNSLKINKAPGIDEICSNIVISIFPIIKKPLFEIFKSSITTGTVPEKLKIAKLYQYIKLENHTY